MRNRASKTNGQTFQKKANAVWRKTNGQTLIFRKTEKCSLEKNRMDMYVQTFRKTDKCSFQKK